MNQSERHSCITPIPPAAADSDPRRPANWLRSADNWMSSFATFDLVAYMTLFVVFVVAHTPAYQLVTVVCTIAAISSLRVRSGPWLWIGLAGLFAPRLVFDWYHNEDHVYLAIYWCLAVGLSRLGSSSEWVLSINARWLIGLAFAFATLWKITTPQFYDGSLCSYKLIHDYRFQSTITQPILGLSDWQVEHNKSALVSLRQTGSPLTEITLEYPDSVIWAGRFLAVWTILIEASLALVFLLPITWIKSHYRNGCLLLFTLTTYLTVPVLGFGALFMTMGIAQTERHEWRTRFAYLSTMGLVLFRFSLF